MINPSNKRWFETTLHRDLLDDLLLVDPRQVTFLIPLSIRPLECRVLSGDPSTVYLPNESIIPVDDLFNIIETNNLLAEVEGKNTFLESLRLQLRTFKKELYLYIPVKHQPEPLWLYLGFQRLTIDHQNFILGKVLRTFEHTPLEIVHYQKTYQDALTKLFTRETLKMHMENLKNPVNSFAMFLDIDGFKRINDQLGHQAGDQFLGDIATHFIANWEYNVLYYRLGGDEFFVYCYDHTLEQIKQRAQQLIHDIENLNEVAKKLGISCSIGIIPITDSTRGYHRLLNLSDDAMYESKKKGKGHYTIHLLP